MASASPNPPRGPEWPAHASGPPPGPVAVKPAPDRAAVLTQLDRLLASAGFRASPQLSRFLRYLVESTLRGEGDQLNEYRLGVDVMGRPFSYEPRTNPVVRLEARRLRAKLREYYDLEGRHDPIRIDIPKGGYAATFTGLDQPPLTTPHTDPMTGRFPETASKSLSEERNAGVPRFTFSFQVAIAILILSAILTTWAIQRIFVARRAAVRLVAAPTPATDAYLLYLRGRYAWNKRTDEGFNAAIDYFNQAIAKDPSYTLAWTGLADSWMLLAEYQLLSASAALPRAEAAARKAISLDPNLAEAHASLGGVKADEWDFRTAEKELRTAIALNPGYLTAHQWLAELLMEEARYDEALGEIHAAQQIEPLSLIVNSMDGRILLFAGRTGEAIDQLHKTVEIEPNFNLASYDLGKALVQAGRPAEAIAEMQRSINLSRDLSERNAALAFAYARAGRVAEARSILHRFLSQKGDYVPWYSIAIIYTALSDKDRAFACLEKAERQHSVRLRDLKTEPFLASLRSDPRFGQLLRRTGLG